MTSVAIFKWAMNPHDERVGSDGQIKWLAERPEAGDDDYVRAKLYEKAAPRLKDVLTSDASGEIFGLPVHGAAKGGAK